MSSLADFVNEQRGKSSSRTAFNVANIGNKVNNSFHGFFRVDNAEDRETLTESPSTNGQLPSSRNRRSDGWFGNLSFSEPQICGLSRIQRIFLFIMFLIGSLLCLGMALTLLPILAVQTRKFAALNTLGSVFFIMSFGFLFGPLSYLQLLFTQQRRIVIGVYFFTVILTLYTSLWLRSSLLTILSSTMQEAALFWYLMTFIPGGESSLKFMARLSSSVCLLGGSSGASTASSKLVLPI